MIKAFIKLRFKQIYRSIKGIGLIRFVFLIVLVGFLGFGLFIQTAQRPNSYYITIALLVILSVIQVKRKDKHFLKNSIANYKPILITEYLLLSIPVLIALIIHKQWIESLSVAAYILLIVNVDFKTKQKSLNSSIQRYIPSASFEWKAGIRKYLIITIITWSLGLLTSFFIGSVPAAIFIFGILSWDFYEKCEPIEMILSFELGPTKFIMNKIKNQVSLYSILVLPLVIAFIIFHTKYWYIPVIEYFLFCMSHIYIILTKYAFYQPNSKPRGAQVFVSIGIMCFIIPVFIPVIWLLSIRFYNKSKENLNLYLNDFN